MRIGFHGKGGSGKTTVAAGFIRYLSQRVGCTIAVDADVNVHLQEALSIPGQVIPLSDRLKEILTHVHGMRQDLTTTQMISQTPPSRDSRFIRPSWEDPLLCSVGYKHDSILFMAVGKYEEKDVGTNCYHGKLRAWQAILHHLLDGKGDYVVADSTAGIDSLGTTLHFAYDLQCFIVEPTRRSIEVYRDFTKKVEGRGVRTIVIGNKVATHAEEKFLRSNLPEGSLLGLIGKSALQQNR